ncbi:MAG: hypothetical protein ABI581_12380, partial [Sediminibacterium sp.]
MKKKLLLSFTVFAVFTITYAQQVDDVPYDFPIRPGMKEWNSFKSVTDMFKACQIPADKLESMSTRGLAVTCLDFPSISILMIYNTPQQGFEVWKTNFNGVKYLLSRTDAFSTLFKIYKEYDIKGYERFSEPMQKGHYTLSIKNIEAILAQDDIMNSISEEQVKELLKTSLSKYTEMVNDSMY